jgi:transcriptional regulator with XRE-family HTH domain
LASQRGLEGSTFGQRVWEAYKELEKREGRISQEELARRIESAGGHRTRQLDVSRWFREVSRPAFEELPAIAEVLGVDVMWLTFGTQPQAKPERPEIPMKNNRKPAPRSTDIVPAAKRRRG